MPMFGGWKLMDHSLVTVMRVCMGVGACSTCLLLCGCNYMMHMCLLLCGCRWCMLHMCLLFCGSRYIFHACFVFFFFVGVGTCSTHALLFCGVGTCSMCLLLHACRYAFHVCLAFVWV